MFKPIMVTLAILFVTTQAQAQVNIDDYRVFGDDNRIHWGYDITDRKKNNLKDWQEYDEHFSSWVEEMKSLNTQDLTFKKLLNVVEMSPACYYISNSNTFPPRVYLYRLSIDKNETSHMQSKALIASFATLIKYEIVDRTVRNEYKRIFNLMSLCGAMLNANSLSIFNN